MIDARQILDFFKTSMGKTVLFAVFVGIGLSLVYAYNQYREKRCRSDSRTNIFKSTFSETRTVNEVVPFNPGQAGGDNRGKAGKESIPLKNEIPVAGNKNPAQSVPVKETKPVIPPISIYCEPVRSEVNVSELYAPYGRLVSCELISTVDSSSLNTPIIALVTEDLYHDGKLIIPAGAEVHGTASKDSMRDRISSNGAWVVVWRNHGNDNGKELRLSGIALDKWKSPFGDCWDVSDGSAGIRGYVINTTDMQQLVAVAAEFLSGIGEGYASSSTTFGTGYTTQEKGGTMKDALAEGLKKAADLYAKRMLQAISRDGSFVRVPAGTQFYLYVTQTIDLKNAMAAGSRFVERQPKTQEK